ncbi:MAG: GrpB family protein [Caldilinea sp. CFX5]|nr:GrpB family protein [Caldilinea sp. CFX5]
MLGLERGIVALQPYAEEWAALFQAEAARLQAVIGSYVLDIQHVGSTAIPGIPAKPILDIAVAVTTAEAAALCLQPLSTLGYLYHGEAGVPGRYFFTKGDPRTHHLHMNEITSADWRQQIAFRDYLRQHPKQAQAYAALKLRLADQFATDRSAYTTSKADFIAGILQKALTSARPTAI